MLEVVPPRPEADPRVSIRLFRLCNLMSSFVDMRRLAARSTFSTEEAETILDQSNQSIRYTKCAVEAGRAYREAGFTGYVSLGMAPP